MDCSCSDLTMSEHGYTCSSNTASSAHECSHPGLSVLCASTSQEAAGCTVYSTASIFDDSDDFIRKEQINNYVKFVTADSDILDDVNLDYNQVKNDFTLKNATYSDITHNSIIDIEDDGNDNIIDDVESFGNITGDDKYINVSDSDSEVEILQDAILEYCEDDEIDVTTCDFNETPSMDLLHAKAAAKMAALPIDYAKAAAKIAALPVDYAQPVELLDSTNIQSSKTETTININQKSSPKVKKSVRFHLSPTQKIQLQPSDDSYSTIGFQSCVHENQPSMNDVREIRQNLPGICDKPFLYNSPYTSKPENISSTTTQSRPSTKRNELNLHEKSDCTSSSEKIVYHPRTFTSKRRYLSARRHKKRCSQNICCSTGYEDNHLQYLREKEKKNPRYSSRSPQLSERKWLVQYLKDVCLSCDLSLSTTHLAILMLDLFMDSHDIKPFQLKLTVLVVLLVAAKYIETDSRLPTIRDLRQYCKEDYSMAYFCSMEAFMLKFFSWKLGFVTAAEFAEQFFLRGLLSTDLVCTGLAEDFDEYSIHFRSKEASLGHKIAKCKEDASDESSTELDETVILPDKLPPRVVVEQPEYSEERNSSLTESAHDASVLAQGIDNVKPNLPSTPTCSTNLQPSVFASLSIHSETSSSTDHTLSPTPACAVPRPALMKVTSPDISQRNLTLGLWSDVKHYLNVATDELELLNVLPSHVAAACLLSARRQQRLLPLWPTSLQLYTGYSEDQLQSTCHLLTRNLYATSMPNTPDSGYRSSSSVTATPPATPVTTTPGMLGDGGKGLPGGQA